MDAVDTFLELADRLRALKSKAQPTDAKELQKWVNKGGLQTLQPGLDKFLGIKAREPEPKPDAKIEQAKADLRKQIAASEGYIHQIIPWMQEKLKRATEGIKKIDEIYNDEPPLVKDMFSRLRTLLEESKILLSDQLKYYERGIGPEQTAVKNLKEQLAKLENA